MSTEEKQGFFLKIRKSIKSKSRGSSRKTLAKSIASDQNVENNQSRDASQVSANDSQGDVDTSDITSVLASTSIGQLKTARSLNPSSRVPSGNASEYVPKTLDPTKDKKPLPKGISNKLDEVNSPHKPQSPLSNIVSQAYTSSTTTDTLTPHSIPSTNIPEDKDTSHGSKDVAGATHAPPSFPGCKSDAEVESELKRLENEIESTLKEIEEIKGDDPLLGAGTTNNAESFKTSDSIGTPIGNVTSIPTEHVKSLPNDDFKSTPTDIKSTPTDIKSIPKGDFKSNPAEDLESIKKEDFKPIPVVKSVPTENFHSIPTETKPVPKGDFKSEPTEVFKSIPAENLNAIPAEYAKTNAETFKAIPTEDLKEASTESRKSISDIFKSTPNENSRSIPQPVTTGNSKPITTGRGSLTNILEGKEAAPSGEARLDNRKENFPSVDPIGAATPKNDLKEMVAGAAISVAGDRIINDKNTDNNFPTKEATPINNDFKVSAEPSTPDAKSPTSFLISEFSTPYNNISTSREINFSSPIAHEIPLSSPIAPSKEIHLSSPIFPSKEIPFSSPVGTSKLQTPKAQAANFSLSSKIFRGVASTFGFSSSPKPERGGIALPILQHIDTDDEDEFVDSHSRFRSFSGSIFELGLEDETKPLSSSSKEVSPGSYDANADETISLKSEDHIGAGLIAGAVVGSVSGAVANLALSEGKTKYQPEQAGGGYGKIEGTWTSPPQWNQYKGAYEGKSLVAETGGNSERASAKAEGNVGKAEGNVGKAEGNLGKAEGNLGKAEGNFGKTEGNVGKAEGNVGKAEGILGKAEGNLGKTQSSVGKAEGNLGKTEGTGAIGKTEDNLGEAKGNLGKAEVNLGKAEGNLGKTQRSVGKAEGNLGKTEGTGAIGKTEGNLGEAKGNLGKAEVNLGKAEGNLGKTEGSVGKAEGNIGKVEGILGKAEGNFGKIQSSVGKAEGNLGKAEGSVGKAEGSLGKTEFSVGKSKGNLGKTEGNLGKAEGTLGKAEGDLGKSERSVGKSVGPVGKSEGTIGKTEGTFGKVEGNSGKIEGLAGKNISVGKTEGVLGKMEGNFSSIGSTSAENNGIKRSKGAQIDPSNSPKQTTLGFPSKEFSTQNPSSGLGTSSTKSLSHTESKPEQPPQPDVAKAPKLKEYYNAGYDMGKADSNFKRELEVEVIGIEDVQEATRLAQSVSEGLIARGYDLKTGNLVINATTGKVLLNHGAESSHANFGDQNSSS